MPIVIVAAGTILGGIAQVVIQWPTLVAEGFRYEPRIDVGDEGLRRVLLLMGPGTVGLAATQINVFVNTILATSQGTGAVSWLDYAFRLMYLPIGLFGVSVATVSTPAISRMVAGGQIGQVRSTIAHAISLMMLLNVPATLGLVVLAEPIVRVIFEHGSFTPADTDATASALRFYALGLLGYSVVRIVSPVFYALGRSRIPVMVSASSVVFNVALSLALVRVLGYRGLALGTALTALLNAATQLTLLRRAIGGVQGRTIAASFLRIGLAATAMARPPGRTGWRGGARDDRDAGDSPGVEHWSRAVGAHGRGVGPAHSRVRRGQGADRAPPEEIVVASGRGWLGLDVRIWKVASTHLVVDAYNNMYAPLLPLLIPHLNLSLATAGTLAMCFQMANSVSQLGFGALADRWRRGPHPRADRAVIIMSFILVLGATLGAVLVLATGAATAGGCLVPDRRPSQGPGDVSPHLGRLAGVRPLPLVFVPIIARAGLEWSPIMLPGLLALSWTLRQVPLMLRPAAHERSSWAS
jgi:peptidoglycan biosynthesis protein MviN/MurJ (putative lipid II flippase)